MSNLDTILAYLRGPLGLPPAQAAAVAGNFQVESGLDPTAENANEGAIGLAQWEGSRRTTLQQFAASRGTSETDLTTQLDFLGSELHGSEAGAFQQLMAATDPASAAAAFDQFYERSDGSSRATRVADAQAIASGQDPSGGATYTGSHAAGSIASSMSGIWQGGAFTVGLKILGAAAAAGLVIVGATHTVS